MACGTVRIAVVPKASPWVGERGRWVTSRNAELVVCNSIPRIDSNNNVSSPGKFWHRHRRPRPVEYNANPDFHSGIKQKENDAGKTPASKKKSAAAALRMQSTGGASEPQTPSRSNGDVDGSRRSASPHGNDDDRGISPISTASSASEPPLAQRVKLNGSSHAKSTPTPAPQAATPAKPQVVEPPTSTTAPAAPASAPPSPTKTRVCIATTT